MSRRAKDPLRPLQEHESIMPLYYYYAALYASGRELVEHGRVGASVQRILTRRALAGQHPRSLGEIIAWLEATARACNRQPTPFVWGGARYARRERARLRRTKTYPPLHAIGGLGGSGACIAGLVVSAKAA